MQNKTEDLTIWLLQDGEPLPCDRDYHPMRTGQLAKELASRGINVHWFASKFNHGQKEQRLMDRFHWGERCTIHLLDGPGYRKNTSFQRIRHQQAIAKSFLKSALNLRAPDLILGSYPTPELCRAGSRYARRIQVPFVIDVRDPWPDAFTLGQPPSKRIVLLPLTFYYLKLLQRSLGTAVAVISMSQTMLKWAVSKASLPEAIQKRCFFLGYLPISSPDRRMPVKSFTEQSPMMCVFYGVFGKAHNGEVVIRAARHLEETAEGRVKFIFIGHGDLAPKWEKLAEGLSNVTFLGWKGGLEASSVLKDCDLGIITISGGVRQFWFGNKFFEYLGHGLPIVCDVGNELGELIDSLKIGTNVTADSHIDLAEAICTYLKNPELLSFHSENARSAFLDRFNSGTIYQQYGELLIELAGKKQIS